MLVAESAAPRLLDNLIAANGRRRRAPPPTPASRCGGAARPELVENRFEGNGAGGVLLPGAGARRRGLRLELLRAGAGRADAVRVAPPAPPAPAASAAGAGRR